MLGHLLKDQEECHAPLRHFQGGMVLAGMVRTRDRNQRTYLHQKMWRDLSAATGF
nr:hypothetical protein Iba_chr07eCG1380 [Ipomoea batatas]